MIIAAAQYTIVDLFDPIQSGTEPAVKVDGMLWLDTSKMQNVLKRWDESKQTWVTVSDTEIVEKVEELETSFVAVDGEVRTLVRETTTLKSTVSSHTTQIQQVENKITPDGIYTLVSSSNKYNEDIAGATMTAEKFEQFVANSEGVSKIQQEADRIYVIVESEDGTTSVELTDEAMAFVSENVEINANKIDLRANDHFTSTVESLETNLKDELKTQIDQTKDEISLYVKQADLSVYARFDAQTEGVEIGSTKSKFVTRTKNDGFYIAHKDDDGTTKNVGKFNARGLATNEISLDINDVGSRIVVRPTSRGGWLWVEETR